MTGPRRVADVIGDLRLIVTAEPDHPGPYYDGWHAALDAVAWTLAVDSDRVPSNGHLCGSCARVIAARTDVEG